MERFGVEDLKEMVQEVNCWNGQLEDNKEEIIEAYIDNIDEMSNGKLKDKVNEYINERGVENE